MKHIIIPSPLAIVEKGWKFRQTIEWLVDNDPAFQRPASHARAAQRLLAGLDAAELAADPVWTIDRDDDHKKLTEAAERWHADPQFTRRDPKTNEALPPRAMPVRFFLAHIDAIAEARVNDPRPELRSSKSVQQTEDQAEAPAN